MSSVERFQRYDAVGDREELADVLSMLTPEDCPDNELRLKASEAAAAHINANMDHFRGFPRIMAREIASAGRAFRNKWYAEHGSTNQRS
jgi:hypothetical protein